MRGMGPERDFLEEEDLDEARATLITTRGVKSKAELDIITATPGFKEHAAEVFRLGEIRWRAIVEKWR